MMLYLGCAVGLLALVHQGHPAPAPASVDDPAVVARQAPTDTAPPPGADTAATTPGTTPATTPATTSPAETTPSAPLTTPSVPAPPVVSNPGSVSHGPFEGVAMTTGALNNSVLASSISPLPPGPGATTYPSDGQLHDPMPAPYVPAGGRGTNGTEPVYTVRSDFDYESIVCF